MLCKSFTAELVLVRKLEWALLDKLVGRRVIVKKTTVEL